ELVKGAAVFPVALEAPGDRAAATVVFARQLALRDLRHQPEEDQVVERGPAQAAVDTEGLLREGALAALALVALDHAAVADAAEGAAALVLESLSAVALGTLTWAEGGWEWHRRVLGARPRGLAHREDAPARARLRVSTGFPQRSCTASGARIASGCLPRQAAQRREQRLARGIAHERVEHGQAHACLRPGGPRARP